MNFAAYFTYRNNKVNNNGALNFIQDSQSQLTEENITNHYIFTMPDKVSKRGFLNKKSNCWIRSLLQVLHYSPLPYCLAVSKKPFAATLYSLFQNMLKMPVQWKRTHHCAKTLMNYIKNVVLNLTADQSIADQMKASFAIITLNLIS